jgi:hypothetical protein
MILGDFVGGSEACLAALRPKERWSILQQSPSSWKLIRS